MAQLSQAEKFANLGFTFILSTEGPFVVVPGKFGRAHTMSRLDMSNEDIKEMFPDLVVAEGVEANQEALVAAGGSARGISHPSGDVDSLDRLEDVADSVLENITNALEAQQPGAQDLFDVAGSQFSREYIQNQLDNNPDTDTFTFPGREISREDLETILEGEPASVATVAIGSDDISFEEAYAIVGEEIEFSEAAVEAQRAAGEAAAAAKDAEIAAREAEEAEEEGMTRAEKNAARIAASGKTVGTDIVKEGDRYYIYQGDEKVGNASGYSSYGSAHAEQQQLGGGSTSSISDFPEIYSTEPTEEEIAAGIQPIVSSRGEIVVPAVAADPELAIEVEQTSEDLTANDDFVNALFKAYHGRDATQEELDTYSGQLISDIKDEIKYGSETNAAIKASVESTYGDVSSLTEEDIADIAAGMASEDASGIDTSGLTDEEIAAAEALSDAVADSDLIYQPEVSIEDIDRYIQEGLEAAEEELDPYYSEVIARAKEAYLQSIGYETQARELELAQQELDEAQQLKDAQASLEERGATFSGEAAETLGELAGLPPEINSIVEGLLQKQQSIIATSSQQRFEESLASLTQTAEELLGTESVEELAESAESELTAGLFRTLGTPTEGSIARERETAIQTRGRELASADIARELATSEDFDTEDLLNLV